MATDQATRWAFIRLYNNQSEVSHCDFLCRVHQAAAIKITKLLTDNGSRFTARFSCKKRSPSGKHSVDVDCKALSVKHRLCPRRHLQTIGMIERFNGRISEVRGQTWFKSGTEPEAALTNCVNTYNHQIPQPALNHLSPVQTPKK